MMRTAVLSIATLCSAGALTGQSYSPVLNPGVEYWGETFCLNAQGVRVGNCPVYFYVDSYYASNAHYHQVATLPPVSNFTCIEWEDNDCRWVWNSSAFRWGIAATTLSTGAKNVAFHLTPSLVGQAESVVTVAGMYGFLNDYAAGYGDLLYANHPVEWCRIGGTDTGASPQYANHGSTFFNRYMTLDAATKLYDATFRYFVMHPEVSRVCVNDMALPYGGKFDISGSWTSPHLAHDRGTAADIAGPGSAQCIPSNCPGGGPPSLVHTGDFRAACIMAGADGPSSIAHPDHAHCSFMDPALYPH